jgi:hypothetical protein
MKHASDEDLILLAWGEPTRSAEHAGACERCQARLFRMRQFLEGVPAPSVPDRDETYGREVWRRLAPKLTDQSRPRRHSLFAPASFVRVAAILTLLLGAFLIGRLTSQRAAQPSPGPVRERILLVAVGDHLERSEVVLLDFVNSESSTGASERARERARNLLADNRLYRQTAARSGDPAVAGVLDELERVLIEMAHGPVSPESREALRRRIESEGVLFKIHVLDTRVRAGENGRAPGASRSQSL